jgi:hypothetical protein
MNSLRVGRLSCGRGSGKVDWSLLYSVEMQIDKDDRGKYSKLPLPTLHNA